MSQTGPCSFSQKDIFMERSSVESVSNGMHPEKNIIMGRAPGFHFMEALARSQSQWQWTNTIFLIACHKDIFYPGRFAIMSSLFSKYGPVEFQHLGNWRVLGIDGKFTIS